MLTSKCAQHILKITGRPLWLEREADVVRHRSRKGMRWGDPDCMDLVKPLEVDEQSHRKPSRSSKDPAQPKVNKQIMFLMYGNTEDPQIPKAILRKKNGAGGIMLPDYWYKGVIRTLQNWHKNRNTDQWNSIECWETNSQMYGQVICDKRGKNMQWRRESLFNRRYREKWTATR